MQRSVLFVTYHYPPSAASGTHRILSFTQHLPKFGWRVEVVAPPTIPWEPSDQRLVTRIPADAKINYVDYPTGRLFHPLRKIDGYMAWLPRAISHLRRVIAKNRPDVVVTSGPPHCVHLAGLYFTRRTNIRWLADFRDPWVAGCFLQSKDGWRTPFAVCGERRVFHHADAIVVNAPNAQRAVATANPRFATKLHCISNGYDAEQFSRLTHRSDGNFRIVHTGELYAGRDPRPFLDATKSFLGDHPEKRSRLKVDFVGTTTAGGLDLGHEITSRGLNDVASIVGQVSYDSSLERMVNASLLLLIDTPSRMLGVPAKLYEYIGANRPILALAAPNSDVDSVLKISNRWNRLVSPTNAVAIQRALEEATAPSSASSPGATESAVFSRESLARKLSDLMTDLLANNQCADLKYNPKNYFT